MNDRCMALTQSIPAHFQKATIKSQHLKTGKLRYVLNLYLVSSGR